MKKFGLLFFGLAWFGCLPEPMSESVPGPSKPASLADGAVSLVDAGEQEAPDAGTVEVDAGTPDDGGSPPGLYLSVDVTGQKSEVGQLCIAVYSSSDGFPEKDEKSVFRGCVAMSARPMKISGLTEGGTYGFSIYHDANSNSLLDKKNVFGFEVPSESYGFSKNAKGSFGPPSWNEARFTFEAQTATQSILLSNPL